MADTTFTARVTKILATWLQDVNDLVYRFSHSTSYPVGSAGAKLVQIVSVTDAPFNADPTGATDSTAAIQAAIDSLSTGGGVYFPGPGTYMAAGLETDDSAPILLYGDGYSSQIKKNANGDVINLGKRSVIRSLYINGNGGSFTGVGVLIDTGSGGDPLSARLIVDSWILDTESYGVEYSGASAGYASVIHNCRIVPTSGSTAAVKYPGVTESNGNRTMSLVWSQSNPLVNLDQADNSTLIGCQGGVPIFDDMTLKTSINGGRFVSTTGWTIDGRDTSINGVAITSNTITFASTLIRAKFKGNSISSGTTITDSAPGVSQGNDIDIDYIAYVPTWTGSGSNPSIENGSLTAAVTRRGGSAHVQISMTAGNTTTFGTGSYSFSIPYAAARLSTGSGLLNNTGTAIYAALSLIDPSVGAVVKLYDTNGAQTDFVGAAAPFTFGDTDSIYLNIDYPIN